jgi:hypothetical protein
MSTFRDILDGGFEAHARALPAGGGFAGERSRAVLRSIHRQRRTRAAVTAGGSVLAVGAVAVGAIALRPAAIAQPGFYPPITHGLYPWCDVSTYPAVNVEALGAQNYRGRVYEDYVNMVFVYVAPDGTHTTLEPDADGTWRASFPDGEVEGQVPLDMNDFFLKFPERRAGVVTDLDVNMTRIYNPGGPDGPHLYYEWTTSVPDEVPPGVDARLLSSLLSATTLKSGTLLSAFAVPAGATVEMVFRWTDGRQVATRVLTNTFGPALTDYADLASVSVRVSNLPDGGVFEITSKYDPSKTWQVACWPYRDGASPSASPSAGLSPSPSSSGRVNPTASPGMSPEGPSVGPTPSPSYVVPGPSPIP